MIVIKAYSDTVKKSFGSSMCQGRFMREVFKASGYDRFPSSSDEDYAKKICNGSKPITDDMIAGFPKPYWIEELADPDGKKQPNRYIGYVGETLETLYFMYNRDHLKIAHTGCRFLC